MSNSFYKCLSSLILVFFFSSYQEDLLVIQGHAHNDYENKNPLKDALDNGFVSVEVDVHLFEDELYVSHDFPKEINSGITLENLYLKPLQHHITKNNGLVYPSYSGDFYLMIDFKSPASESYKKLKSILLNYETITSVFKNGVEHKKPVTVFISGNRPMQEILGSNIISARLDGRPKDLDKNLSTSIMPVISDNYSNILTWRGERKIDSKELNKLKSLVERTHNQNKKLRLWGTPDNRKMWKFLLDNDVDLINTDKIEEFSSFMKEYKTSTK